ncbi:MAG: SEC-C domain-containing protein [Clostridiales Family XIII bacterium]|jgi:hypothetical protein|nr:SEC-C domain-containing protein [Clostridiales Family XIII bacterium]
MAKSLEKQWLDLLGKQTKQTMPDFWGKYSDVEQKLYAFLLKQEGLAWKGVFSEMADSLHIDKVWFMGWLDGMNDSLKTPIEDLEQVTEETELSLEADPEKLYWNMHAADADHLYGLPEWDAVLPEDRRAELAADYRRSRTVHKEKLPGRNDPCPCGSGKKYKKCCGATATA